MYNFSFPYLPEIGFYWGDEFVVLINRKLLCKEIPKWWHRFFTTVSKKMVKSEELGRDTRCLKITGKRLIKMLKRPILVTFWNLLLAVKQCYQVGQFLVKILVNVTFWVIFKQCARQHNKKKGNNKKLSCSVLP